MSPNARRLCLDGPKPQRPGKTNLPEKTKLKITTALAFVTLLLLPAAAWSQDVPIKIYLDPLLSGLDHKKGWFDVPDSHLADAVRAAFSNAPFQIVAAPSDDALTLAAPDGVKKDKDQYNFTVVFSQDGTKLGEALEYCPMNKLADCTDQLILDAKSASQQ